MAATSDSWVIVIAVGFELNLSGSVRSILMFFGPWFPVVKSDYWYRVELMTE